MSRRRHPLDQTVVALALFISPVACHRAGDPAPEITNVTLTPLAPRTHTFDSPLYGAARSDYYFVDHARRDDPAFKSLLRGEVTAAVGDAPSRFGVFSVLVYERTTTLNEQFSGTAEDLQGSYDKDLVAYARWRSGQQDTFYMIDKGFVVYDMIEDRPTDPIWSFD